MFFGIQIVKGKSLHRDSVCKTYQIFASKNNDSEQCPVNTIKKLIRLNSRKNKTLIVTI